MREQEHILIVDDDEGVCKSLAHVFRHKGYVVETSRTGQQALARVQEKFFNLILLDIKLPDVQGIELLAPLKAMHPDTVLIMATAYASLETSVRALNEGASAYITKPWDVDEVLATVRDVLEKQRLLLENRRLNQALRQELAERARAEERLREHARALAERVKKLNCLYGMSHLVERPGITLDEVVQGMVDLIPSAWQYPEITCACITLGERKFKTEDCGKAVYRQASDIVVRGEPVGDIAVYYREARPESDEGPFLQEERRLLDAIAERLGKVIERLQAQEELRQSQQLLEQTFAGLRDAVFVVDADTLKIVRCNPAALEMFGYEFEEMLGRTGAFLHVNAAMRQEFRKRLDSAVAERNFLDYFEFEMKRKDGTVFPTEHVVTPLKNERGQRVGWVSVVRDVSGQVHVESVLRRYAERLSVLREIDQAILSAQPPQAIAQVILQRIGQLVPCTTCSVAIFDFEAHEAATLISYHGAMGTRSAETVRLSLEGAEDIIAALRQGKVQVVDDVLNLDPLPLAIRVRAAAGVRSYVSAPLLTRGELIGTLGLGADRPGVFTPEHVEIACEVATELAVVFQQSRLREQVEQHAAQLEQRVLDRTRELQTLYDVTAIASECLDLEVVLEWGLDRALAATRCRVGAIQLLDESGGIRLAVQQGLAPRVQAVLNGLSSDHSGLLSWVIEHGMPLVVTDMSADARLPQGVHANLSCAYVGVPMRVEGQVLGVLSVVGEVGQPFSAEDVALLGSIADHLAVAVENDRLRQRAQHALVVEERGRLARELHDSVTQLLYSLGLFAETGQRLAGAGELSAAQDYLLRIGQTAQQALKEMRMLVYQLRPLALEQEGLVGALQGRLDTVERRLGVDASLSLEGALELPARVEAEFYHIALEALNNALRHAMAATVRVRICADDAQVELEVQDDGVGFDPSTASDVGGLGLAGMRERAARLGGSLSILSTSGEGTRVKISVAL
jgi:PAS domain S-box-containing protein